DGRERLGNVAPTWRNHEERAGTCPCASAGESSRRLPPPWPAVPRESKLRCRVPSGAETPLPSEGCPFPSCHSPSASPRRNPRVGVGRCRPSHSCPVTASLLAQDQVHDPAAPHMRPRPP